MATSSLLELDLHRLLNRAEHLARIRFPRTFVEVTLEPELDMVCIRFKKPTDAELGEPLRPQVHLFKHNSTNKLTAVELLEIDRFPQ